MQTERNIRARRSVWGGSVAVLMLLGVAYVGEVAAQRGTTSRTPSRGGGNVVTLDKKAEEARDSFMKTSAELAREYEDLGELERAQEVLRAILKLNPGARQIEDKVKQLEETRLSKIEAEVEVDPSRGWVAARVGVEKGKTMRFVGSGECKVTLSQFVTPEGVSSADVKSDMVAGIPFGALMGMVVDGRGKQGQPFAIGAKNEVDADSTGQLFLRVNIPPQAKVTGKYKVVITGDIKTGETSSASR